MREGQKQRPIGSRKTKEDEFDGRAMMIMAKAHVRLALDLEKKNKLIEQHSLEMTRHSDMEQMRFMFDCFSKGLSTLPDDSRELMSLQRQRFLEDMRAEVAAKQAKRVASEAAFINQEPTTMQAPGQGKTMF